MRLSWLQSLLARRRRARHKPLLRVPFIGREAVLATLDDCLRQATEGGQVFVALQGPAGSGKSALLEEFMGAALPVILGAVGSGECRGLSAGAGRVRVVARRLADEMPADRAQDVPATPGACAA